MIEGNENAGETRFVVAPHVHSREFDGELVLLDLEGGEYFALNPVATCMWRELVQGRSPAETALVLEREFDAGNEQLVRECRELALELVKRGLLRPRSP